MYQLVSNVNPVIFRGYDLRGLVDSEITEDVMYTLGRAFGTILRQRRIGEAAVGRDNRLSSEAFSQAFRTGVNQSGVNTIDLGLSLSQIVYFSGYECKTKGIAMITASHNPKEFNGLKLGYDYSSTMESDEVIAFKNLVLAGKFASGNGTNSALDVFPSYVKHTVKHFHLQKKWKIVVDGCNTGSGFFYPQIFRAINVEVIEQNCTPDGNFPSGVPDPTESSVLDRLAQRVIAEKADLGFAYDTDGDRMAAVDGNGRVLWMDQIVALFVKDVLTTMPGSPIVFNTLCSQSVTDVIQEMGGQPIMWTTGHSFIKAKVKETKAPFGGELSGHIYFTDNFYGHDDGAYASLRLLQYLENPNLSLAQAIDQLPKYISSPEIKLGLADAIKFSFITDKLKPEFLKLWPDGKYVEIDGVRVEYQGAMAIVRASQNGPYVTVKFEGKTQAVYDQMKVALKNILSKYPEIDWAKGVNTHGLD